MSNVLPNGQIRFFQGVPIDENYENSLDFLTKEAQYTYFLGLTPIHTMAGATRVRDGVISVNCVSDTLLNVNYMMFQNENFLSKWFFAFIKDVQYVNNNMCYVFYQIDDIQTWLFDVTVEECFVEREHTATDGIFEHVIDEGFEVVDYKELDREDLDLTADMLVIFTPDYEKYGEGGWSPASDTTPSVVLGNMTGVPSVGYKYRNDDMSIDTNMVQTIGVIISNMIEDNLYEGMVAGVCVSSKFFRNIPSSPSYRIEDDHPDELTIQVPSRISTVDGNYHPKNNKLFNAPYCIYKLMTTDGQSVSLKPEMFTPDLQYNFIHVKGDISPHPSVVAVPARYAGQDEYYEKAVTFDAFPQCPFSIDGYKAWVASGGLSNLQFSTAKKLTNDLIMGAGVSAFTGNATGMFGGGINAVADVFSYIKDMEIAERLPADTKGNFTSAPQQANRDAKIIVSYMSGRKDVLKTYDDYFTMFGYKVNKIKKPSRRNRTHYTYVKTRGCHVDGGAPADAIRRIETIYDNGIRFWVNASEVGKYSEIDNSPS